MAVTAAQTRKPIRTGLAADTLRPLATAWHSNKFINPVRDGAVLPILNLNGYKIANPTILARISHEELEALFIGYGYAPYFVEGANPAEMHQSAAHIKEEMKNAIIDNLSYARTHGTDRAELADWVWPY